MPGRRSVTWQLSSSPGTHTSRPAFVCCLTHWENSVAARVSSTRLSPGVEGKVRATTLESNLKPESWPSLFISQQSMPGSVGQVSGNFTVSSWFICQHQTRPSLSHRHNHLKCTAVHYGSLRIYQNFPAHTYACYNCG